VVADRRGQYGREVAMQRAIDSTSPIAPAAILPNPGTASRRLSCHDGFSPVIFGMTWQAGGVLMGLIAALIAVFIALVVASNTWLQSTVYEVRSPRIPPAFDGFCIVQISDLHNSRFGKGQSRLLRRIRRAQPDLITLTGDLAATEWRRDANNLELVSVLPSLAPVYFATGNHDIFTRDLSGMILHLEGVGVHVLRNASVPIERGGQTIALAGIDDVVAFGGDSDSWRGMVSAWRQELNTVREGIDPDRYAVLLSHRPEFIYDYARAGFDLVLAGHAHGGLVRIPFVGPLYAPGQGKLPRYTSGMHVLDGTTLVVSRGLGRGMTPLRFLNRPEVVVVRLRSGS
jgi:predicted MPP superfamily phosphohydrolase